MSFVVGDRLPKSLTSSNELFEFHHTGGAQTRMFSRATPVPGKIAILLMSVSYRGGGNN
jgi:hypothetical protein